MREPIVDAGDTPVDDAFERVFASGKPQRVGSFRYLIDDDRWEWSDDVARMHGYAPGTVRPTTDLLLKHKHPEDKAHVAAMLAPCSATASRSAAGTASSTRTGRSGPSSWSATACSTSGGG